MAGRHRAPRADRHLSGDLRRAGAALLLATAPLAYVGTAAADTPSGPGPGPERRAHTEDNDWGPDDSGHAEGGRDGDSRDGDSRDSDDRDRYSRGSDRGADWDDDTDRRADDAEGARDDARRARDTDSDGRRDRDTDSDDRDDRDDSDDSTSRRSGAHRATTTSGRTRGDLADDGEGTVRSATASGSKATKQATTATRSRAATTTRSTTARTTTARAATGSVQAAKWDRLAQCESHQRWTANTGNGYRGGLQFSDATWRAYGGAQYAASANQASRMEQIAVAEKVRADQGWRAWPACSRQLGYA